MSRPHITDLLDDVARGSEAARDELFQRVYSELKRMARQQLRRPGVHVSINPTTLLHETWIKLARSENTEFQGSHHFFNIFSQAMRHVVVDIARANETTKHGRGAIRTELTERIEQPDKSLYDILTVDAALKELEKFDVDLAELVEWHFFGGIAFVDIANDRGVTERTVRRHWDVARLFLAKFIGNLPK